MHGIGVLRHTMRRVPVPNFTIDVEIEGVGQLDVEEAMLARLEMVIVFR